MKIKETKKSNFFSNLKKLLKAFYKVLFSKKSQIIFIILFILGIFILGNFSGLLISGFFGTLDHPSNKIIDLVHNSGITYLTLLNFQKNIGFILDENIKIPFNYIKGQFSNPEKIYIDIAFENYQKLAYKREVALEKGILFSSNEDFVPATIRYEDREIRVLLRLKGDYVGGHLKKDKESFRIKVRGDDSLFGMKTFSIQSPDTRNYINEFIFHQALKREDVLSLRYHFIEVVINGKNRGIYALEEHFDKELIEYNNRREGVIVKFDDEEYWNRMLQKEPISEEESNLFFFDSKIDSFKTNTTFEDPIKSAQFEEAKNLLELFRKDKLKTSEVFDIDKLAKYFAITGLTGSGHATFWFNIRFYYNPITSKLEPIGFDGNSGKTGDEIKDYFQKQSNCSCQKDYYRLFFQDNLFFEKYVLELEKVSQKTYLDNLFEDLDNDIVKNIKIIHKDTPYYHFSTEVFYNNQDYMKNVLSSNFLLNPPAIYDGIEINFIRQEPNLSKDFLIVDENSKEINIKQGTWKLNESLIIPPGYILYGKEGTIIDLIDNATILSYSQLEFIGNKENPFKIISSDGTGQGLSVLNVEEKSKLVNVLFEKLSNPSKGNWELMGAITFYESPILIENVRFSNMKSEDGLNIIRSEFEIKNSIFENSFSDCLDIDFGEGIIESTTFVNCGNDGVDISGSVIEMNNLEIINMGDKGISVGEKSEANLKNIVIEGGYIGVASKDLSNLEIKRISIFNSTYNFAIYQKKTEFGPASINAIEVTSEEKYLVEKDSECSINEKIILGSKEKVYDILYLEGNDVI